MSTTLPTISWKPCSLSLPPQISREGSWFVGTPVRWLIQCEHKGLIKKIGAYVLALLVVIALLYTWVGIPLVFWGVKEWIQQKERVVYLNEHEKSLAWISQAESAAFLQGRTYPLESAIIQLDHKKREEIIEELCKREPTQFSRETLRSHTNTQLLILASTLWEDYLSRFNLRICANK